MEELKEVGLVERGGQLGERIVDFDVAEEVLNVRAQHMRQPLVAHRGDQVDRVIAADSAPVGERASGLHEFHVESDRIDHSALHNPVAHRGDVEGARPTTFGFRDRHCDEGLGQVGAHAQLTGQFLYESVGIPHDRSALRRDVAVAGVPREQVVPCSLQRLPGCCAVVDGVGVLRAPVIREVSTSVEHATKRVQSDADEPIRRRLPRAPPDGGACHGSACRFRCSHDRSLLVKCAAARHSNSHVR